MSNKLKSAVFIGFFFLGINLVLAQCPTVSNPTQTFCDLESVLVGNLMATDTGGGIVWYDTANSTTPLNNAAGLNSGEDYYADDNTGTCGTRSRVDVIIFGPPSGQNFQGVCLDDNTNATIGDLVAIGNDVQWYLQPSGGVALSENTILIDNTLYYADQANPNTGCRTSRLSVLVNVGFTPIPEGETLQEFCVTNTFKPTVADLEASGLNNWYPTLFSAVPLALETPLIDGQTYYATTIDPPCESTGRLAVFVTLTESPDAGTDNTLELCENNETIDLFTVLEGTPDAGGVWSPALNSGTGVFDPNIDLAGIYTYTITADAPCSDVSAEVTVNLKPAPLAGTDGMVELCSDGELVNLFTILGGMPAPTGTWSPALNSGSGIFDPAVDPEGIYKYTVSGIPPCDDVSATVMVTVSTLPNAGLDALEELCDNIEPINLLNSLGGNPDEGGVWSPVLSSGTGIFDPTLDPEGIYTYTVFGMAPCSDAAATVTISITEFRDAGTEGSIDLCSDDDLVDLFDSLEGSPESGGTWTPTLNSGTGIFDPNMDAEGMYSYTLTGTPPCADATATVTVNVETAPNPGTNGAVEVCSDVGTIDLFNNLEGNPDEGGFWTPSLNSGTGVFDPSLDAEGTYTYTITGNPPCNNASASVTVTIVPFLDAGLDGTLDICTNDDPVNLFARLNGMPQSGGVWTPTLNSGTGLFDPSIDAAGDYIYTLAGTASCPDSTAKITVSIEIVPDAGLDGILNICSEDEPINLFDSLNGTPDAGGTWSPILTSGTGVFNPLLDSAETYTYTQFANSADCENDTATVRVTISELGDAGIGGNVNLCNNNGTVNLFDTLGGSPDSGGSWTPTLNSGSGIFDPIIDPPGRYTYTINGVAPCVDVSSEVNVSVVTVPEAGLNGSITLCNTNDAVDLFDSLGGNPAPGGIWTPTLSSGTGRFDPMIDSAGIYTYTIASSSVTCPDNTATVNVLINTAPNAGSGSDLIVCINDGLVDLFDNLQGAPDAGGSWSPPLISGPGLFDPTLDAEGEYTYTVVGQTPCDNASATLNVSLAPQPSAGEDVSIELCDTNSVDLFTVLGGTPDSGGSWSPPLISGSGIFDPNIDREGTYTYTVLSAQCNVMDEASVTVTFGETPNLTGVVISAETDFCLGSDVVVTISGASQLTDGTYSVNFALSGANTSFNRASIDLVSGISFFNISGSLFSNPGITTISITDFFFNPGECSGDPDPILPIDVNIEVIETPALVEGGASFCEEDMPTIANLTGNVIGIGTVIWYNAEEGGTIYESTEMLQDGQVYYGAYISENECESSPRLQVTVTVETCILELTIPDGFSPNDDGINDNFNIVNLNDLFPNFKLTIFNRYGNELYSGDINTPRWNGTSKNGNGELPVGVYFYILEFNDGVREPKQGRVYLSR